MPAVSTASGFSPTARRRRPKRVRAITHQVTGTDERAPTIDQDAVAGAREERAAVRRWLGRVAAPASGRRAGTRQLPSTTVRPAARMLMATPLTTWLPRWVMQAKPCSKRHRLGGGDAGGDAQPGRAGDRRDRGGEERRHQHLAFEPDIDDAAALREQPAHGAQDQRRRDAQRRGQRVEEDERQQVCPSRPPHRDAGAPASEQRLAATAAADAPARRRTGSPAPGSPPPSRG